MRPVLRPAARFGLLAPLFAGAALLAAAEFSPLYEIRAITAVLEERGTGPHHGYALLAIALALVPAAWGAVVGGSRAAALGALALALAASAVVLAVDLPAVDETGTYPRTYEGVEARARSGLGLGLAGAALALAGAAGTLVVRPGGRSRRAREGAPDPAAAMGS